MELLNACKMCSINVFLGDSSDDDGSRNLALEHRLMRDRSNPLELSNDMQVFIYKYMQKDLPFK